jgi:hypothetical protein
MSGHAALNLPGPKPIDPKAGSYVQYSDFQFTQQLVQELQRNLFLIIERQKNDLTNIEMKMAASDSKVLQLERTFIENEGS